MLREIAIDFVTELSERMDELDSLVGRSDYQSLVDEGHGLKGTGGTVGLATISKLGARLEEAAHAADSTRVNDQLMELRSAVQEVCAEISGD